MKENLEIRACYLIGGSDGDIWSQRIIMTPSIDAIQFPKTPTTSDEQCEAAITFGDVWNFKREVIILGDACEYMYVEDGIPFDKALQKILNTFSA